MKKTYILTVCILLANTSAHAAGQPYNESTQLQSQEQEKTRYLAQVDPDSTPALLQAMQQHRFQTTNRVRIQNMIQEAQKQGLPTEPLMNKVHEGIAKKVPEEKIVQAVQHVQKRYENAYRQARTLTRDKQQVSQLGQVIAEAYTAGLIEQDCLKIMTQLQTRTRTMNQQEAQELRVQTMVTARIMARRGTESATVSDVLGNALQNSYQAREMHTLQNSFMERSRYGSPEDVARGLSDDISHGTDGSGRSGNAGENGSGGSGNSGGSDNAGGSNGSGNSGGSDNSGGSNGSGNSSGSDNSGGSGGSSGSGSSGGSSGSNGSGGSSGSGSSGNSGSGR